MKNTRRLATDTCSGIPNVNYYVEGPSLSDLLGGPAAETEYRLGTLPGEVVLVRHRNTHVGDIWVLEYIPESRDATDRRILALLQNKVSTPATIRRAVSKHLNIPLGGILICPKGKSPEHYIGLPTLYMKKKQSTARSGRNALLR